MSIESLLANAIPPDKTPPMAPSSTYYTSPKTYGVYEISSNSSSKRYRYGNHPVRLNELIKEFGKASCIALFYEREQAEQLARHYNAK
ncbi:hypothetical protein [Amphritea balenae]|uniref:hypothetical protein n=1 Tax=Amphritea balenae TaxID=452629 RepID=UPI000F5F90AF|nr:hypothetical protein [Amphritea balenae]GGK58460.1 hypothetical protein GCM10007941_05760 [Amphritea balenae]